GAPVGEVTSAGYSGGLGRAVAMGYVRGQAPLTDGDILAGHYEIDAAGTRHAARVQLRPPFPARPSMA
ncbi:MAG: hypothetical protein HY057_06570, partial [Rhodospirillales bacterium]|nr:hypothetical protein [Rhodospirillales bacterium]